MHNALRKQCRGYGVTMEALDYFAVEFESHGTLPVDPRPSRSR
jgi:hypothetical protein